MANEQINVPSLVAIIVLSGLIIRYLFFAPSTNGGSGAISSASSSSQQQRTATAGRGGEGTGVATSAMPQAFARRRDAAGEQVLQMFPQADRRAVLWDLQRNNVNMALTAERILAGRLDTPPDSFNPPSPSTISENINLPRPALYPDLITRYKLQGKIADADLAATTAREMGDAVHLRPQKAWSASKEERQSMLEQRRNEMILKARRAMEAKIEAEKAAAAKEIA